MNFGFFLSRPRRPLLPALTTRRSMRCVRVQYLTPPSKTKRRRTRPSPTARTPCPRPSSSLTRLRCAPASPLSDAAIAADAGLDGAPPASSPALEHVNKDADDEDTGSQIAGGFLESSAQRSSLRSKIPASFQPLAAKVRAGARQVAQKASTAVNLFKSRVASKQGVPRFSLRIKVPASLKPLASKVRVGAQQFAQHAYAAAMAVQSRVAPWVAVPSNALAPPELHTTLLGIVLALYNINLLPGQMHAFSFNRQCVPAFVIQTVLVHEFLSWVLHVPALNAIVVVFRGTKNDENKKYDAKFLKTPCRLDSLDCGMVHGGFFTLYRDSRPQIHAAVRGFLARRSAPITSVYVTGHSLGAAATLIGGLDLAHVFAASPATAALRVSVVTWGCPRVGDARWAAAFGAFGSTLSIVRYRHWRKFGLTPRSTRSRYFRRHR